MTETYSIQNIAHFNGVVPNTTQFEQEIIESSISTTITRIDTVGDSVYIVFVSTISAGDKTTLDCLVSSHVPATPNIYPDMYIKPGESFLRFDKDAVTHNVYGKYSKTVIISKETQGDYTTIKDAVTNNNTPGTIFMVYPGTYNENNPITLPANSELKAVGTAPQTIVKANNVNSDLFVLNGWCKVSRMIIEGANGSGSRGVYFDGSVDGTGSYSLVSECIIKDCDIGLGTDNGPDTLIVQSCQIISVATGSTLSKGVSCKAGGKFVVISGVTVYGIPSPPYPSAVPITDAYYCSGLGSKITLNNCGVHFCTNAATIDDDGEMEINLLGATYNSNGLKIGSTGYKSKLRANLLRIENSQDNDIDIASTEADITIFSSEIDSGKIKNPNSVRFASKYHGTESNTYFVTTSGDVRFGDKKDKTTLSIGQGKYDNEGIAVLSNDNLEIGTWTNNTVAAQSFKGSVFNLFSGTSTDNCMYIGRNDSVIGMKVNLVTATTSFTSKVDIIYEYWNGSSWIEFKSMVNEASQPAYQKDDSFISYVEKLHIRFGIKSTTSFVDKTLDGITKNWVRIRVVNTLVSIPAVEYIKLHTNETKITSNGFIEHFGDSRSVKSLGWTIGNTEPSNASPLNQDVYLSDQLGVGRKENKFADGATDRLGLCVYLPLDVDNGFPVKLKFAIIGSSGTIGNVEFVARWNTSNVGSNIYRTTGAAPSSSLGEKLFSSIINITSADTEYRGELELDLNLVNPTPANGIPHLLWVTVERDATAGNSNDTYPGSISLLQMSPFYISWRNGGYMESF